MAVSIAFPSDNNDESTGGVEHPPPQIASEIRTFRFISFFNELLETLWA
ncbi:MAG: hypothetical protein ACKVT0_17170 [Planctomycetaceae bacterium]